MSLDSLRARVDREDDGDMLAEALGIVGYMGIDSASETISGHKALPAWRAPIDLEPKPRPSGTLDATWRHRRTSAGITGTRLG